MWAYGSDKNSVKNATSIPLEYRKPSDGCCLLDVPIPEISHDEVLVKVKASALNYNSIWSSLAHPVSPFQLISGHVKRNSNDDQHLQDYSIFGSDASGEIVKIGESGKNLWKEGDQVIIHCNVINTNECIAQKDGMLPESQSIWGYETNFGAFAEYTKVKLSQLIKKPENISWDIAASFSLTHSTAYRMLISPNGACIRPGQNVLIWGGAGGLGSFAIQLVKLAGANPIPVVSSNEKEEICKSLGAQIVINREKHEFDNFTLDNGEPNYLAWRKAKLLIKKLGINDIHVVFEHVGRETLGLSLFLLNRGGAVVTCAASSGYNAVIDLRYLWMSLKRIIGSHFANYYEANNAAKLIFNGKVTPLIHSVNSIKSLPEFADKMYANQTYGKIVFSHE